MRNKILDIKLMLVGIAVILTATPLSLKDYGLSLAAILIGLFFVIVGLILNSVEATDKQKGEGE